MKVELSRVIIDPDRQRKELGDIDALCASLTQFGQLQNIIIDENFKLVAGERRTLAAIKLGWTHIEAKFKAQLTAEEAEAIELEENLQRKQLTWQEEIAAKARVHAIKQQVNLPGVGNEKKIWSIRDTAAALGESLGGVTQDIQLANLMVALPELKIQPSKRAALRQVKIIQEKLILNELARRASRNTTAAQAVQLVNMPAADYLLTLADASVDLILTDPPYGIDVDQMGGVGWIWNKSMEEIFNDRSEIAEKAKTFKFGVWKGISAPKVVIDILPELVRVLKDGAHFYMFCAVENFPVYADLLTGMDMTVRSRPLIWKKNIQSFTSFFWKYSGKYEVILLAHKGEAGRVLNGPADDILEYPIPQKRIHPTEKPVGLLAFLIKQSTSEGDVVLDTFAGSASVGRAALLTKRRALLCELDGEMVNKARGLMSMMEP